MKLSCMLRYARRRGVLEAMGLALIAFCPLPTYAQGSSAALAKVQLYTDNDPPYVELDERGQVVGGLAVDKVYRVLHYLGLPTSIVSVAPWARSYDLAKAQPGVMIFPIAKSLEREKYLTYTFVIVNTEVYFYKLRARTDIDLKTMEDAKKYSICVVLDDYRHEYLAAQGYPHLDTTSDSTNNVRRLVNGRCDLLPSTEVGMARKLKALEIDPAEVVRGMKLTGLDNALYAAFNKNTAPAIIEKFEAAARQAQ